MLTPGRHNMVAIHNSVNFTRTSTLFVQSSVVLVLYTHNSTRLTWEENKTVMTRLDTPKYGETLKFMYIKYQPILVVLLKVYQV